jgi:hypothetical protein
MFEKLDHLRAANRAREELGENTEECIRSARATKAGTKSFFVPKSEVN